MGRKPTINREAVLDAAENVVSNHGAAGLTIDAVAKAAGITKGGVQSCFGNKESMIEAMLMRWGIHYDQQVAMLRGESTDQFSALKAHLHTTISNKDNSSSRSAVLLSALIQSPDDLGWIREWYAQRHSEFITGQDEADIISRIAFLATEGLFFLRHLKLMELSDTEWEAYSASIKGLLDGNKP
ncbi:TPA: TetR/AcrR family transcriptional regulator [Citrobacter freundii]